MLMTSEVLDFTESIRGLMTTLFTAWGDRHKQIVKKWRALPSERKAPFLQQARENRAALRMKKTQQVSLEMYVFTCMCKCVNPLYVTGSVSITGVCTFYLMLMGQIQLQVQICFPLPINLQLGYVFSLIIREYICNETAELCEVSDFHSSVTEVSWFFGM